MKISGRYSQHARRAMMQARLCAREQDHSVVDTSHLLVGVLRAEGSLGQRILQNLNLNQDTAEQVIIPLHTRRKPGTPDALPMTRALRTTLSFAVDESRSLGHHYIGTEHLLLGLTRGGGGAAPHILHAEAINMAQLRRQIRRVLQSGETEIGLERALRMARLSEMGRRVLNRAGQIAERYEQTHTDLLHLILALAQEQRSPAGRILSRCGLDAPRLEAEITWPRMFNVHVMEDVLDEAVLYAERLGNHYTGTDHIVLALAHNRHAGRVLAQYGVDLRLLTREIEKLLRWQ